MNPMLAAVGVALPVVLVLVAVLAVILIPRVVPNPGAVDGDAFTAQRFGFKTDRATGNIAQAGALTLFTVTGGRILLLGLIGEVTTIIQAQANNMKIISTPTVGTAVDIAAVVESNGKEVGALAGVDGTFATALSIANAGAGIMCARPVVIPVGTIQQNCVAASTGQMKWSAFWLPLDPGARLA